MSRGRARVPRWWLRARMFRDMRALGMSLRRCASALMPEQFDPAVERLRAALDRTRAEFAGRPDPAQRRTRERLALHLLRYDDP